MSHFSCTDGRKPIYLLTLAVQCIGSVGVASAWNVPTLLAWRIVQAFGSSSGLSVGMGVIGDIYKIEERGTASGVFFAVRRARESASRPATNEIVRPFCLDRLSLLW